MQNASHDPKFVALDGHFGLLTRILGQYDSPGLTFFGLSCRAAVHSILGHCKGGVRTRLRVGTIVAYSQSTSRAHADGSIK